MKRIIASLAITLTISFGTTVDEGIKAYENKDYKTALSIFEDLASKNNAAAQSYLGVMYYNGQGVKQDYKKAIEWYEKAANQGDAMAQNNLGVMYVKGEGVRQDYKRAKEWFGKACDGGYQKGCDEYKKLNQQGY